ncbi:MAG: H-X9-DG-CTERM domain-containing protein [Pseudomarimonas sp.]
MRYLTIIRTSVLAAACLAADAQAQTDQFSLNFEKIRFEYHNAHTGALPFALDLVHGDRGEVTVRSASAHDITLKRGSFFAADPLPEAWLFFDVGTVRGGPGVLTLGMDQSAAGTAGGGPQVKVFAGSSSQGASLHVSGTQVLMGDGSVRFLRDAIDVRLSGQPSALFNQPRAGEALEARLPTPAIGQTINLLLIVSDDRGASMRLPVRITRPR